MPLPSWLTRCRGKNSQREEPELQASESTELNVAGSRNAKANEAGLEAAPHLRRSLTLPLQSTVPIYYDDNPPFRRRSQRTSGQEACLLFRLPLELRIMTYEHVLAGLNLQPTHCSRTGSLSISQAHHPGNKCTLQDPTRCFHSPLHYPRRCGCEGQLTAQSFLYCRQWSLSGRPRCLGFSTDLLLTCRRIYSEAVDILYEQNKFTITHVKILFKMQTQVVPQRLQRIRQLSLEWRDFIWGRWPSDLAIRTLLDDTKELGRAEKNMQIWSRACRILASMTNLRRLVVDLRVGLCEDDWFAMGGPRALEALVQVKTTELFEVLIPPQCIPSQSVLLERGAGFKLVDDKQEFEP